MSFRYEGISSPVSDALNPRLLWILIMKPKAMRDKVSSFLL